MTAAQAWLRGRLINLMAVTMETALRAPEEAAQEWVDVVEALAGFACYLFSEPSALAMMDQAKAESERRFLTC